MSEPKERSSLERHIQTILAVVVASILLWVGSTVAASREEIIRLQEQVSTLQAGLVIVATLDRRIDALELRVGIIENKVGSGS